jgi:aldose 1-epimerase
MLRKSAILFLALAITARAGAGETHPFPDGGTVTDEPFGSYEGRTVQLHTLTNKSGMSVSIMDYGATVVKILVPDRSGKLGDVALGFDRFAPYLRATTTYFGATIGRYANRIAKGQFTLGKTRVPGAGL